MASVNFFFLFVMLMLNSGGRDLVEMIPTDAYWKSKNVTVSAEAMLKELQDAPTGKAPDISALIKDLGADDFRTRRKARQAIAQLGPIAIPQLQEGLKSTDPEVVNTCRELIAACTSGGKAAEVRKLMAIRTLGELKAREALPRLKALADSKEPFVGEYATAAMAFIEGKPYARPGLTAEQLKADAMLMPADCAVLAQLTKDVAGKPTSLEELAATQMFRWQLQQNLPAKEGENPNRPWEAMTRPATDELKKELAAELVREAIALAEVAGNLRIEAATIGVADKMESPNGFLTMVFHGKYDPKTLRPILGSEQHMRFTSKQVDGMEIYQIMGEVAMVAASPERLAVAVSPFGRRMGPGTEPAEMPLPTIVESLKAGKGKIDTNQAMMALLAKIDTKKPAWGICVVPEFYKQLPLFAPFDQLTVTASVDEKGELTTLFTGEGQNADAVKGAVDMVNKSVAEELTRMKDRPTSYGPGPAVVEVMKTIKAEANGAKATLTAKAKAGLTAVISAIR